MNKSTLSANSKGPNRRESTFGQEEVKPKLLRAESRRAKDESKSKEGSQINIEASAVLTRQESYNRSTAILQRENSSSKKKKDQKPETTDTSNKSERRGSALEKHDSHSKKERRGSTAEKRNSKSKHPHYDSNRRGSLLPGGGHGRKASIFFVPELHKISDNQIINISEIHDDMVAFRMIKFSADLMIRLRNPMDDLETLVVPVNSKPFLEIAHELYTITTNYRYLRQNEILTWAKDEEIIEDVLCAFAKKSVDFDSTDLTSKLLDSFAAGAGWEAIHKAISDIYMWFPVENKFKTMALTQQLKPQIVEHLLNVIGNWTWYLRQSHVALCTQISMWFNTLSATEWKESRIPVVYGAFNDGYDITHLFAQILHRTPTLDLVKMNFICTKIGNSLAKYPNQKEFIHLDLFRHFVEFRAKLSIMAKLLQLCRIYDTEKERIFSALAMFEEKAKKPDGRTEKNGQEKVSAFARITRTKTELLSSLVELKKATSISSYVALYPKILNSQLTPSFTGFTHSLTGSILGPKKYDLPEIFPKTVAVRLKNEAIVHKLNPKPLSAEKSDQDNFFAGGIAIQIEEASADADTKPLQAIVESNDLLEKQNAYLKTRKFDEVELVGPLTMPESVCKTHYDLNIDDNDTLEAIYGISFGNVDFGDLKRVLTVIGCNILSEDGIGLLVSHKRCKVPISFMAPFPDLHYKLFALDRIKNTLQDFLGIYYENFNFK